MFFTLKKLLWFTWHITVESAQPNNSIFVYTCIQMFMALEQCGI